MINPAYTVSVHHGKKVVQPHNVRDPKYVLKELHIDPNGVHETWHHENIKKSYHRIFDKAVKEYNEKQKDLRRVIKDYYKKIKNSEQKHLCYEVIVTIGNKNSRPDDSVCKEIMKEFVDKWVERNPNFELIGVYYHADEPGVPHIHIDYIPLAYNNSRGMSVQTSQTQALREMGFINHRKSRNETEIIQWEARERAYLDGLCRERGIEVYHPDEGKGKKHLEKEQYILTQQIAELEETKTDTETAILNLKKECLDVASAKEKETEKLNILRKQIAEASDKDWYIKKAVEYYGAFTMLCYEEKTEAVFEKIKKIIENKIAEENERSEKYTSRTTESYSYTSDNGYDSRKDPLSIDYEP